MAHVIIKGLGRIGLFMLGFVFVINSSLHSYLILANSDFERETIGIGLCYLSNVSNKLAGTFLSGASNQFGGLTACLAYAAILCLLSWLFTFSLKNLKEER